MRYPSVISYSASVLCPGSLPSMYIFWLHTHTHTHTHTHAHLSTTQERAHIRKQGHAYAHAYAHSQHKLPIPSLRNTSSTPAFVSTRYSRHTCRDTSRMLSAHAQTLFSGLARFVKECFLHGVLPQDCVIQRNLCKYTTTKCKCLERMRVRQVTRVDGSG